MALRKNNRKKMTKRRPRKFVKKTRRTNKNRLSTMVVPTTRGIADRTIVKLIYQDRASFTTGATSWARFRGNNIFDPFENSSGTGGVNFLNQQPSYRDQYAAIYQTYRVLGSSIKVSLINNLAVTGLPVKVVLYPSDDTGTPTDPFQESTIRRSRTAMIRPGADQTTTLKNYMSTNVINGVSKQAARDADKYLSAIGAGPTDTWYWLLSLASFDQSTACSVLCTVQITYYVIFADPLVDAGND